jgi:hypothetical protein
MGRKLRSSILAMSLALMMSLVSIAPANATTTFTLLDVTSLADTEDPGTLRWAITQANATTASDYGKITFSVAGAITLTSDLPQISRDLTIEGPGQNVLTVSGADLYQIFYINSGIALTASDLTLASGSPRTGLCCAEGGGGGMVRLQLAKSFDSTNMTFRDQLSGPAVFIRNAGVATYTNATFTNNSIGIASDHGGIPQLPAGVTTWADQADTLFSTRTYVYNSLFTNNASGIRTERFTLISGSTFRNNVTGAFLGGASRSQVYNSLFEDNTVGYQNRARIRSDWNMGTDNRLVQGNTFRNNGTAISIADSLNTNPEQFFPGASTYLDNTFEGNTKNLTYGIWDGTANQTIELQDDLTTADFVLLRSTIIASAPAQPEAAAPAPAQPEAAAPAYSGPILEAPVSGFEFAPGSKVNFSGSALSGVTSGSISGLDALLKVVSDSELEITIPTGLESGSYDLVLVSDSGQLTVQSALRVRASSKVLVESGLRVLSKPHGTGMVKTYAIDVVGAGKVQFMLNGKEIAWVNAVSSLDPKLRTAGDKSYLVRTIDLAAGQNLIEILVGGVSVHQASLSR